MARPKKVINQKQFESLCEIQCTQEEICDVLDVCEDTLDKWCHEVYNARFSVVFRQKRSGGKSSLRRSQWLMAKSNPTMAIWLGKQYLGQSDKKHDDTAQQETVVANAISGLVQALKDSES